MTPRPMHSRRHFLVLAGTGLVGVLAGCSKKSSDSSTSSANMDSGNWLGGGVVLDTGSVQPPDDCTVTESDNPGPFYIEGVPVRNDLDLYGDPGVELTLSGFVLDSDCNPIPNAVVDIWHADPTTVAVEDLTPADSVPYDNTSSEMRYRGQTATNAEGRYSFHTKKPGWYLNGSNFRPMHIHVKIWVDGTERLTTQLYFEGDPHMEGDPWASAARALVLVPEGDGAESGTFNFTIA